MKPKINVHIFGQLIYDKGAKNIQGGKLVLLIDDVRKTGQPHAEE